MTFAEVTQYARLVFAGVLLFVIAYQLWVARYRPSEPMLYLVAAWAGAALVMVVGRTVQHTSLDPATVLLGARIFHTGVLSLVPLAIALTHELRGVARGRLFWICTAVSAIPVPLVWIGKLIIGDEVRQFETLAGPILGPAPASLGPLGIPYLVAIASYFAYVGRQAHRPQQLHQRLSVRVAYFGLLPALLNDVLLYSDALVTLELVGLALFVHVMTINFGVLARAGELFAGLEETVESRTAELLEREQQLSRTLAVRRRILDAIPDVICLLRDGRFDYVNEAAEIFFGRSGAELSGTSFTDRVAENQRGDAERCMQAIARSTRSTVPAALRFVVASGVERSAEVAGLTLELGDGRRMLVTLRDVTERNQLLAKLQVADRLASVGMLAAGVAHEINNPLTFIGGNLEIIKLTLQQNPVAAAADFGPDGVSQLIDECLVGTQRIARIVSDLNLFTRASDERTLVDCKAVVENALKIAKVAIRHRADISVDYGRTPPVSAESRRLSQVFVNLLVNAFQSIPDDGTRHSIHITTKTRADGWAVVEIADSGAGIDPALLPVIFDPFVTTKPPGHGTGLGLFICLGIVTDIGGDLRLVPRKPNGTIAQVALPPGNGVHAPATPAAAEGTPRLARPVLRVLIADDEEIVLRTLKRLLKHHDVTTVPSGAEAIQALATGSWDVILCDLVMPGRDGTDVWRKARELGCDDRFVLMTGGATSEAFRRFIEGTPVPVVTKPLTSADVEAAFDARLADLARRDAADGGIVAR